MTAFVRKAAEDAVLREDWHENEDGSRLFNGTGNFIYNKENTMPA